MKTRLSLALVSASFLLTGCAWQGQTGADFYSPLGYGQEKNIILGYLDTNVPKKVRYGVSVDYNLDINSYKDVLEKELKSQFKEVRRIQTRKQCPECQLFASTDAKLIINQSQNTYQGSLDIRLDVPEGRTLGVINARTYGDASPTAAMNQLMIANGMSMGLLSGASISQYGDYLIAIGEQAIGELVNEAGSELATNPRYSEASILGHQPDAIKATQKRNEELSKSAMLTAAKCTSKAISQLDDGISDAQTVAVAAGQRCQIELETWANSLCRKDNPDGYCGDVVNYVTSIRGLQKIIVPQVLEHRRAKKSSTKIQTQTIIVPLIVPEEVVRQHAPVPKQPEINQQKKDLYI